MTGSMEDAFKKAGIKVGGGRGSRRQGKGSPPARGLPPGYLEGGYFDEKGNLRREMIIEWPRAIASTLVRERMKIAAIRNFFTTVRGIESAYRVSGDFDSVCPRIWSLAPKVNYQAARGIASRTFKQFIETNLPLATKNANHFLEGFVEHFQCVVAYFTGMGGEKGEHR